MNKTLSLHNFKINIEYGLFVILQLPGVVVLVATAIFAGVL